MNNSLDPKILEPIEKIARFIETGDETLLSAFATENVVIIENFAPHVFQGTDAVQNWSKVIGSWDRNTGENEFVHSFGSVQDLVVNENTAFLSLPTHWTGLRNGNRFHEDGGWAFVLVRELNEWRVRCYGWAVTDEKVENESKPKT